MKATRVEILRQILLGPSDRSRPGSFRVARRQRSPVSWRLNYERDPISDCWLRRPLVPLPICCPFPGQTMWLQLPNTARQSFKESESDEVFVVGRYAALQHSEAWSTERDTILRW